MFIFVITMLISLYTYSDFDMHMAKISQYFSQS